MASNYSTDEVTAPTFLRFFSEVLFLSFLFPIDIIFFSFALEVFAMVNEMESWKLNLWSFMAV